MRYEHFNMLPIRAFKKSPLGGLSTYEGGGKGDAPDAPDYTAIARANEVAAKYAYDAADNRLSFDRQVYNDAKPYVEALQADATKTAKQQQDMADINKRTAELTLGRYTDKGIPAENQMYEDAKNYGTAADQDIQAGVASNQVQSSANQAREAANTRLSSMGIRPDSGAAVAANTGIDISTAATAANAGSSARLAVKDKGIALRAGAANFAAGTPTAAATGFSTAIASGNSSTGNLTSASSAGLPSASLVDGGYAQQAAAGSLGSQAALGMGNILNTGYGIESNAAASSSAGNGAMVGGIIAAGATMF